MQAVREQRKQTKQEDSMKILAIDLGKYNSVACLFTPGNQQPEYETIGTHRYYSDLK
jgi:molecular chaperone DnaK (HSP70)